MIRIAKEHEMEKKTMRDTYCETLIELASQNDKIVHLDADLLSCISMAPFQKKFPERTFDLGIQEANMIGVAAGMSAAGLIPFAHSFAPFASRRCYDQIFMSCAYAKLNVRILGSDPGITAAFNGGTHMPFEDMGILRSIPNITIIEPVDTVMLRDMIIQTAGMYGVFYIRMLRKNAVKIYEDGSAFEIGKGVTLREGNDVTIIATGIMVNDALKAAVILEKENIRTKVVNIFTLKPIDKELIIKCAEETGSIVTIENHNVINGLGSAVSEVLSENIPTPLIRVGVRDEFGEVGPVDYLKERFGLTVENICSNVRKVLERKK